MAPRKSAIRKKIARKRSDNTQQQSSPQSQSAAHTHHDAAAFADNMNIAANLWQTIMQRMTFGFLQDPQIRMGHADPFHISEMFMQLAGKAASNPYSLYESNVGLLKQHLSLWQDTTATLLGKQARHVQAVQDRRFKDEAWNDSTYFDYMRRSYLINSQWASDSVRNVPGIDAHTAQKAEFFTRQFMDAMAPSNFLMTNPEVMRETLQSNGANLVKGLQNMLEDIERGKGKLRISMTNEEAFTLGVNIACTPGQVVYENDLMQLIQYEPTTKQVFQIPILITPAWINKYYVLDLRPENSLVKWLVDQGYSVFMISWVNPDEGLRKKRFDDYLSEGPLTALDVIEEITGSDQTSLIGYCLGGTLVSIVLSYLRTHGMEHRAATATYLTTMVDFTDAGELAVFIDDEQIESLEDRMQSKGYLDAADMATTFNMLRANDLIWSFVVNNYLMGREPFPFDLLYWNSDSTRMPSTMHSFYLRNMYQKNLLVKPGGIELLDTPINITKIKTPTYILSTKDDHIAPWESTYAATQVYDGPITFVLSQSGHIAGVINPPAKKKYGYWSHDALPARAKDWLDSAAFKERASWWPHWHEWHKNHGGKKVAPPALGGKAYPPIEAAPGAYARIKV